MKNLILLLFLWLPLQMMAQQTETRNLEPFTAVSSSASIKVILVKGSTPKAEIETDGELEDVLTEVSNGKLKISRESNEGWFNFSSNNDDIEVKVYFQDIEALKVSSSSKMEVMDPIQTTKLALEVSSSGKLSVTAQAQEVNIQVSSSGRLDASLNTQELVSRVSSSGKLNLTGDSEKFEASVSSSGNINGDDFVCSFANLKASSSGKIKLTIEEEINASASSSGRVNYKGNPKLVTVNTSSGGQVDSY